MNPCMTCNQRQVVKLAFRALLGAGVTLTDELLLGYAVGSLTEYCSARGFFVVADNVVMVRDELIPEFHRIRDELLAGDVR